MGNYPGSENSYHGSRRRAAFPRRTVPLARGRARYRAPRARATGSPGGHRGSPGVTGRLPA